MTDTNSEQSRAQPVSVSAPPSSARIEDDRTQAIDVLTIRRIGRGEVDALGELFDRHAAIMLGLARRILGNVSDAEDLIHDVFVEVSRKAATYDESRGRVRSWLLMRVRSRSIDRVRSIEVARRAQRMESLAAEPASVPSVADARDQSEDAALARRAMRVLTAHQHSIVERVYFRGETLRETAEALGIPLGTAKSRLASALQALRVAMGEPSRAVSLAQGVPRESTRVDRATAMEVD